MQGSRNTGDEVNQADAESVFITETSFNSMLNPGDNEFPNNSTRSTYANSTPHAAQNHNWWRFGESSSISGPSNQVKTNHQLPQDGGAHHFVGLNGMMVHGGSHMRNGPSFLRGSSSNSMPQHVNMDSSAQTSGVVIRDNNCGSSLGSSIQATGESSSGPASSLGGWGSSCKRKALEGAPSHSFSGGAQYSASSSLSLASQTSPNVSNHFGRTQEMFAINGFHSARSTETLSRPSRRLNPRQPHESVAFSISHPGSSLRPTGSPFVDPLPTSITNGENQTNIVHLPALTRNIHQFASFSSRASTSSGLGMPGPPWETPRSNPEQPMFAPATEMRNLVHDQSIWGLTPGSSIDSPFVPRAGASSALHAPTWIPPQSAPQHNPSRTSEISPWSLFPSIESQSAASHGALLPTGPSVSSNEVAMQSGSISRSHRSRQRRSGLLSERQNYLLHLRHLGRSLAADSDGRNQLISEIRQVLSAMRRGGNLRIEDYVVLDPLIYQGMSEMHDRHREMRLDVDNMSYEELLALGERIGDVSTGLKEEVILKTMKQRIHTSSVELHQDMEPCCICQEEYAEGDELGTLECGHEFHKHCIKQWVMLKNLCPICKTVALTTS